MGDISSRLRSRTPEGRARALRGVTGPEHDILTVEGVAKLLHCTMDAVRRIPDDQLPAHQGPGQHILYLREEVVAYIRSLPRVATSNRSGAAHGTTRWIADQRRSLRGSDQ